MRLSNAILLIALGFSLALTGCGNSSFSAKASRTLGLESASDDAKPKPEKEEGKDDGQSEGKGAGGDEMPAEEVKKLEDRCGKKSDFANIVRLNGNQQTQSMRLAADTLIIMNGNTPKLTVEGLDQNIARVCIYMRGNEGEFAMTSDKAIAKLDVLQRGNQNKATLHLEGEVAALGWDAAGNENRMTVDGAGSFTCPSSESSGNENVLECKKP